MFALAIFSSLGSGSGYITYILYILLFLEIVMGIWLQIFIFTRKNFNVLQKVLIALLPVFFAFMFLSNINNIEESFYSHYSQNKRNTLRSAIEFTGSFQIIPELSPNKSSHDAIVVPFVSHKPFGLSLFLSAYKLELFNGTDTIPNPFNQDCNLNHTLFDGITDQNGKKHEFIVYGTDGETLQPGTYKGMKYINTNQYGDAFHLTE